MLTTLCFHNYCPVCLHKGLYCHRASCFDKGSHRLVCFDRRSYSHGPVYFDKGSHRLVYFDRGSYSSGPVSFDKGWHRLVYSDKDHGPIVLPSSSKSHSLIVSSAPSKGHAYSKDEWDSSASGLGSVIRSRSPSAWKPCPGHAGNTLKWSRRLRPGIFEAKKTNQPGAYFVGVGAVGGSSV